MKNQLTRREEKRINDAVAYLTLQGYEVVKIKETRFCDYCGEPFKTDHLTKRFCNADCRSRFHSVKQCADRTKETRGSDEVHA